MLKHSDAVARQAQAMAAAGARYGEIAEVLGLANAKSSVQALLKRKLEPLPDPGPPPFIRETALPIINRGCQWIEGDVQDQWSWCGAKVSTGEVWCNEHKRRVYVRRSAVREDAD